jgi:hypothetical protein
VNAAPLQTEIAEYLSGEFVVAQFGDERLVCDTPMFYPDGDSVAVFLIEQDEGRLEITDFGEGYAYATDRKGIRRGPIREAAQDICSGLGLEFAAGRVSTVVDRGSFADAAWRVASASARIAEAQTFARAERAHGEDVFTDEVEQVFRARRISVEREPKLLGDSGHEYTPTLFVPDRHLIVEPISPEVAWVRAASVYAEFGDLAQANGYRLLAVVDDRAGEASEKVVRLLNQVGDVANFSRREGWLARLAEGGGNGDS